MVASCLDSLEPILLEGFESKEDLVACLKASANVPRIAGDPVEHRSAPRASLNLHTLRAISSFRLYFAAAVLDSNTFHTSIGAIANKQSSHLGVICCSSGIGACPELVQVGRKAKTVSIHCLSAKAHYSFQRPKPRSAHL